MTRELLEALGKVTAAVIAPASASFHHMPKVEHSIPFHSILKLFCYFRLRCQVSS